MARHYFAFKLTTPDAYADGRIDPGPLPSGVPAQIPSAERLVGAGLLAGGALGVDIAPAVELLDAVAQSAAVRRETYPDAVRLLHEEDLAVLGDALAAAGRALADAVDGDGRPVGPAGQRLAAARLIELDDEGRVVVGTAHVLAAELVSRLPELAGFLAAAAEQGRYVVLL